MKRLIPFLCLMIVTRASGQMIAKNFTTTSNEFIGFYEYKPTDYATEDQTIKHPMIIFLHGGGESGNGTTDLPKVCANGLAANVKNGHNMRFFWNGKWETFLVLMPQLNNAKYGWWYNFYTDELIKYAKQNLRIDTNRIFLTGLSMGGGGTWFYAGATLQNAQKLAAAGISCGACQDVPWCNISNAHLPIWAFHAQDDASTAPVGCTASTIARINQCNPEVVPYATYWPTGGHGIWGRVYDPGYTWQNPNIYEWFLGQNKSLPVNKRPLANAGPNVTIGTATGAVNLSGALSKDLDGKLLRFIWRKVSGPAAGTIVTPVSDNGLTRITGLTTPGVYQYELKAIDDRADWTYDVVNVTVVNGSTPNIPPITEAGPDQEVMLPEADLNGTNSYDPDGTVTGYRWTKIAGPAVYTMSSATASNPTVTNLLIGVYQFELETTDNVGAKSKDTMLVNASTVVLPIKLLYFKATRTQGATQLLWATDNEDGQDRFEVEASQDGEQFQAIGSLEGADKASTQRNYSFTDRQGYPYYRLKIISRNNRVHYSSIVRIDQQAAKLVLDYFPNPARHTVSVLINDAQKGVLKIRLMGMDGKLAAQQQWVKQQDVLAATMDVRSLATGIYVMEVTLGNNWREVRKIVKE